VRFTRSVLALLAALGILAAGAPATLATTLEACQAQLDQLQADTLAAQAAFDVKGFASATAKLDAADAKLTAGKTGDAISKLGDFRALLAALATAPKPKLDAGTAQAFSEQALAVEGCIASIGTP
jgi:hypothetical protein